MPHDRVRRTLTVLASAETVRIFDRHELLATHPRSYSRGEQIEDPEHVRALVEVKRQARHARGLDRLAHAVPQTRELIARLAERGANLGGATAELLALLDLYGPRELAAAVREALAKDSPNPHSVRLVLKRRTRERSLPPPVPVRLPPDPKIRNLVVLVSSSGRRLLDGWIAFMSFDVFLCYNKRDTPGVRRIAQQLRRTGLQVWLDEEQLRPGFPWQRALEEAIEGISAVAVFVGPSGIGPWQREELEAYLRQFVLRGCPVIPVLLENCPDVPKLPGFLAGRTWVDFRRREPEPLAQLVWGISGRRQPTEEKEQGPRQGKLQVEDEDGQLVELDELAVSVLQEFIRLGAVWVGHTEPSWVTAKRILPDLDVHPLRRKRTFSRLTELNLLAVRTTEESGVLKKVDYAATEYALDLAIENGWV